MSGAAAAACGSTTAPRRRSWPGRCHCSAPRRSSGWTGRPTPSPVTGPRCTAAGRRSAGRASREEELEILSERLRGWIAEGIEPHAIGVAARSGYLAKAARESLESAGIKAASLTAKGKKEAVRTGTMHGMKGLEFQAVAVIGAEDGTVPAPAAVTSADADPLAHEQDLQRERCVLFVACTRARDHLHVSYTGQPSPFLSNR